MNNRDATPQFVHAEGAISRQGTLIGDARLLEKPFTGDKLARAVRDALDRPKPS